MQKEELEEVVLFLYSGKISQDDKGNVLENLINVFGFPENMNLTDFTQVKQELKVEAEIKKEVVVDDNFDAHEEEVMDFINSKEFDNEMKNKFDNNLIEKTIEPMNKKQGTLKINKKKTETKFKCEKCGASFTREDILQLHIT